MASQQYFVPNTAACIRLLSKLRVWGNIEDLVHEVGRCLAADSAAALAVCARTDGNLVQRERRQEMRDFVRANQQHGVIRNQLIARFQNATKLVKYKPRCDLSQYSIRYIAHFHSTRYDISHILTDVHIKFSLPTP